MPDIVISLFALGILAGLARSDLQIPKGTYDTLSILLMLAVGLKGGMALHGNLSVQMLPELAAITLLGFLIPLALYPVLRRLVHLSVADSASFAAHYGSVSAGTFAVAIAYVAQANLPVSPQTTLYLVLLEMPAIITGVILYRRLGGGGGAFSHLLREALTSRGVVLLLGGVIIGFLYGPPGMEPISSLFIDLFKGFLALFLLEMGLCTAGYLRQRRPNQWRVVVFALLAPPLLAMVGLGTGLLLELPAGSILLLAVLTASASYIAAPAAIRAAIPDADNGKAMFAALGVTFPLNVVFGIPLYHAALRYFQ
jgi:uncharacterized protein